MFLLFICHCASIITDEQETKLPSNKKKKKKEEQQQQQTDQST